MLKLLKFLDAELPRSDPESLMKMEFDVDSLTVWLRWHET